MDSMITINWIWGRSLIVGWWARIGRVGANVIPAMFKNNWTLPFWLKIYMIHKWMASRREITIFWTIQIWIKLFIEVKINLIWRMNMLVWVLYKIIRIIRASKTFQASIQRMILCHQGPMHPHIILNLYNRSWNRLSQK